MTTPRMSPNYHGISYAEAAEMFDVSEATVRSWFSRYDFQHMRTKDGRIDAQLIRDWYDNRRDQDQAGRRGNKGTPRVRDVDLPQRSA